MKRLIMTVGLPRSGKSTWAREQSREHGYPMVNPDSIRLAIHGQPFITSAEPFVWATAKVMVRSLFLAGHDTVILDSTNTTRRRRDDWRSKDWFREFKEFDTGPAECRERAGLDPTMWEVIHRMAYQYEPITEDEK